MSDKTASPIPLNPTPKTQKDSTAKERKKHHRLAEQKDGEEFVTYDGYKEKKGITRKEAGNHQITLDEFKEYGPVDLPIPGLCTSSGTSGFTIPRYVLSDLVGRATGPKIYVYMGRAKNDEGDEDWTIIFSDSDYKKAHNTITPIAEINNEVSAQNQSILLFEFTNGYPPGLTPEKASDTLLEYIVGLFKSLDSGDKKRLMSMLGEIN